MRRGPTGSYNVISTAGGETARAFVPDSLPPSPPLAIDSRIHQALLERPIANSGQLSQRATVSVPAVIKSLRALEEAGIVRELTGRKRNRVYSYFPYVQILSEGTQPL